MNSLKLECIVRGLMNEDQKLRCTEIKKKIQQQEKDVWVSRNPGKEDLEIFLHFKKDQMQSFSWKISKKW